MFHSQFRRIADFAIIADFVIGTSAGIADAVSYASGQFGRNLSLATQYLHDKRYMGIRHLLNPKNRSYYNLAFAFDEIPNKYLPFDYDAFARFKGEVLAAVTNVNTGKAEYLPMPRDDRKFDVLRASCALPLLFPVIRLNGVPYMDGGICAPVPADEAIRAGCEKTIVVLTRERGYRKPPERSLALAARLYRKYPDFAAALQKRADTYNKNLERIDELEAQGKAFVIAPGSIGQIKRLESDPQKLEEIYRQGYRILKERLPQLLDYIGKDN
jgi:predicted patatin/cPLA2 family phospholipase